MITLQASSHKGGAKTEVKWHTFIALDGTLSCAWVALLANVWLLRFASIGLRWPEPDHSSKVGFPFHMLEEEFSENPVSRTEAARYSASRNVFCFVSGCYQGVYRSVQCQASTSGGRISIIRLCSLHFIFIHGKCLDSSE